MINEDSWAIPDNISPEIRSYIVDDLKSLPHPSTTGPDLIHWEAWN